MRALLSFLFLSATISLSAQTTVGMVAYYTMDSTLADVTGNTTNTGIVTGLIDYDCGVLDESVSLDGTNTQIAFGTNMPSPVSGPINNEFDTEDISISFYFRSEGNAGTQYLMSKRDSACTGENEFLVRYVPSSNTLNCVFTETASKSISLLHELEDGICWNHVVIVRENTRVTLYVNGAFAQEQGTLSRIDLLNNGIFTIGNALCKTATETGFEGLIDELRVYNRALDPEEVMGLYFRPDQIINRDTNIFLGSTVQIELTNTCAEEFSWTPSDVVMQATDAEPTIVPKEAGAQYYVVEMSEMDSQCAAVDSIRINVVDPNDLDCEVVFLPKAFTPNGDNLNDTYGISNPFAVPELISLEIFDRWGGRVFATANAFEKWDGTFNGEEVNPGVMIYKVRFVCEGIEKQSTGTFTILK